MYSKVNGNISSQKSKSDKRKQFVEKILEFETRI